MVRKMRWRDDRFDGWRMIPSHDADASNGHPRRLEGGGGCRRLDETYVGLAVADEVGDSRLGADQQLDFDIVAAPGELRENFRQEMERGRPYRSDPHEPGIDMADGFRAQREPLGGENRQLVFGVEMFRFRFGREMPFRLGKERLSRMPSSEVGAPLNAG